MLSPVFFSGCAKEDAGAPSYAAVAKEKEEEQHAPAFTLTTLDGSQFSLSSVKGRPVVINFWASWCGPCRSEAGELQNAYLRYRGKGVLFIGIAVDDTTEEAGKFIKEFNLTFPSGLDRNGSIAKAYNLYGVPMTFVVQRDGVLSYIHVGTITGKVLDKEIQNVL
ncbi:MAG: TlpA disulfide reductase family protein [Deltaproteobacteria bacterium]